jgi:phage terminase large subunit-like protein
LFVSEYYDYDILSMSLVAETYIQDVLDGRIPAGQWIVKAFQRHKKDLINGKSRGLKFDPHAGDFVIDFCQTFCNPPNQDTPMVLMPWQHAILWITYGWKRADGTRRFRRTYLEIAKKNGKTALAAALSLYHLICDGEQSPRVFIAATTHKQAGICFKEAAAMRGRNAELRSAVKQSGKEPIIALYTESLGRLSMMSRDAATEDGAVVSCAILDELHRWKHGSPIYPVLRYGGRTRKQPLMIETTTAGASADGTSLCWAEREYGTKILDGHIEDDEFAPWIFSMDAKDDWKNPANWVKSNPSLGYIINEADLLKEFAEAQGKPSELGNFKRFALNIWSQESADPAIEIEKWDACCREDLTDHPDPRRLRKESLEQLKGRLCFVGVDLAPKLDTSAIVCLFPPLNTTEKWRIVEYFWCPADNVAARVKRDKVPYDLWSDKGFITLTPGNLTDVRFIAEQITEISKQFDVKELAYDEAWSSELIRMLAESGFDMKKFVPFPQTFIRMNSPCQELMRKILRKEFSHDHNPVMRWQMANLRWNTQKGTGFVKPARDSKREKIDGCASLIMALARATDPENTIKPKRQFFVVTS